MIFRMIRIKQAGQQRDQRSAEQDDAAARHELFHALAFGTWIVGTITFQEVDNAPHAQASAQRNNESLQSINSGRKELHRASISPGVPRP